MYEYLLSIKPKNSQLKNKINELIKSKLEMDQKQKIINSLEEANRKLIIRQEEYENNNRDWEIKVSEIINKFNELENENIGKNEN